MPAAYGCLLTKMFPMSWSVEKHLDLSHESQKKQIFQKTYGVHICTPTAVRGLINDYLSISQSELVSRLLG